MLTAVLIVSTAAVLLLLYLALKARADGPRREELSKAREESQALRIENASLRTELENLRTSMKQLGESEERLKKEFENLSNRIFENRSKVFAEQNAERLSGLLKPFREQMDAFRKRVDDVHTEEVKTSAKLIEQIRQLQELSNRVSDDANNLARAIKGESKTQGDWGELIVERIFEASGLQKGVEYLTQTSFRDEDGRLKRPDFLVLLPGEKVVVVDSKVSLTAYERYAASDDENTGA
ncbi:MAG TPA: DNA recombination protein RmuC, partial [Candidatus Sabulitectum sp.]|nr:DNA recombination protein RmuC [Candidatus Sabulitectum sp.]